MSILRHLFHGLTIILTKDLLINQLVNQAVNQSSSQLANQYFIYLKFIHISDLIFRLLDLDVVRVVFLGVLFDLSDCILNDFFVRQIHLY